MALSERTEKFDMPDEGSEFEQNVGVETPDNTTTEQNHAAEFHGKKNRAHVQKKTGDPDEKIDTELDEIGGDLIDPKDLSVSTKRDRSGFIIDLKTGIRIPWTEQRRTGFKKREKGDRGTGHTGTKTEQLDEYNRMKKEDSPEGRRKKEEEEFERQRQEDEDLQKNTDSLVEKEAPYEPFPEPMPGESREETPGTQTPQSKGNTEQELRKLETENALAEQRKEDDLAKEKAEKIKIAGGAAQEEQEQAQVQMQTQDTEERVKRATRIKTNLDQQLNNLEHEKLFVKASLILAQAFKAMFDALMFGLELLIDFFTIIPIIGWIIAILLRIIWIILWLAKKPIQLTIFALKKRLASLNKQIEKTKKLQKKATFVIQSMQRRKRLGITDARPAKFKRAPQT